MWGYVASASVEPPETPTWTPCPDCGAPMEDDDETVLARMPDMPRRRVYVVIFNENLGQQIVALWFLHQMTEHPPPTAGQLYERLHEAVTSEGIAFGD